MANKSLNDPNKWVVELSVDAGICYDPLPCVDMEPVTENDGLTLSDYACYTAEGKLEKLGTIADQTIERVDFTITGHPSEMDDVFKMARLTAGVKGCTVDGRITNYCNGDTTKKSDIVAWIDLSDWRIGNRALPRLTNRLVRGNAGGGTANEILFAYNGSISGNMPMYLVDDFKVKSFVNTDFDGTTPIAIFNCGEFCNDLLDCGESGIPALPCERWYAVLYDTGANTFSIWETDDTGGTWSLASTVTSISGVDIATVTILDAGCDWVFTSAGVLEGCDDAWQLYTDQDTYTTAVAYARDEEGGNHAILADNNSVFILQDDTGYYEQAVVDDLLVGAQSVIATDGTVYFTGGIGDGVATGAYYQYSKDGGVTWTTATLNNVGWSTTTDQITSANVTGRIVTVMVSNGTDTKVLYTEDGVTWTEVYLISGNTNASTDIYREGSISYFRIGCEIYANWNALCDCSTFLATTVNFCGGGWGWCQNYALNGMLIGTP